MIPNCLHSLTEDAMENIKQDLAQVYLKQIQLTCKNNKQNTQCLLWNCSTINNIIIIFTSKLLYLISLVNNTYAIVLDKNLLYSAPVLLIYFNCQETEPSFIKNFESSARVCKAVFV